MLGKTEGRRRRGQETDSIDVNLSKLWELMMDGKLGMPQSEGAQRVGRDRVTELNWHFIRGGSRVLFSRPEGKGFTQ